MTRYLIAALLCASPAVAQQRSDATLSACQQILGGQLVQGALREDNLSTQLDAAKAELARLRALAKGDPTK